MVEALVTVVIFALGLLSVAGLHSVSKRSLHESVQRTAAAQLGSALLEKMRANPRGLPVYVTAGTLGGSALGTAPAAVCNDPLDPCTPAEVARQDLWEWEQELDGARSVTDGTAAGGLLTPSACIRGPFDGSAGIYTLVIAWQGSASMNSEVADPCGDGRYGENDENKRLATFSTYLDPLS
jgi:type IV pilus assembly protein PilV